MRFKVINGEILPSTPTADWLAIEHVLQRYRDVWVPIDTYPFLAVDTDRVDAHCSELDAFPVSIVVADVDEAHCRAYLAHLRHTVSRIYEQLPGLAAPIVTKDNVKWMGDDLEAP